jgi:GH18 family chitinase
MTNGKHSSVCHSQSPLTRSRVSYDDEETIKIKTDFAKKRCLSGMMVWSLDYDIIHKPLLRNVVDNMSNMRLPWLEAKELPERVRLTKTLQTIFREQHDATTVSRFGHSMAMFDIH